MIKIKKLFILVFSISAMGSVSIHASMLDAVIYNVIGQVSNAVGARVGDEIYYGSSKHKTKHRKHRKKRKKKRVVVPTITSEMKIQKALTSLGFYHGKIDGDVNSYETRSSIKQMNIAYNISNTASLKTETKDGLIYLGTLFMFDRYLISQKNDKKSKGCKLQTSLKIHGFYFTKIDGVVGGGTRRCIAEYKTTKGLSSGSALDFEEEYQLVSSAKELNDKNIEDTIQSLKPTNLMNNVQEQAQTGQAYNQYSRPAVVNNAVSNKVQSPISSNTQNIPQNGTNIAEDKVVVNVAPPMYTK